MRNVVLFMVVSLDGYIEGPDHDLSWHNVDAEFNQFAAEQMQEAGTLLFGRKTYQLMESYWPTAKPEDPNDAIVAEQMNTLPKVVFSKTLEKVKETDNWGNVRLVKDNVAEEIQKLKQETGKALVVLGSNNLCVTLLQEGLLDELRILVNPVVIGKGTPLFRGIEGKLSLQLLRTKTFNNGNVLLTYQQKGGDK